MGVLGLVKLPFIYYSVAAPGHEEELLVITNLAENVILSNAYMKRRGIVVDGPRDMLRFDEGWQIPLGMPPELQMLASLVPASPLEVPPIEEEQKCASAPAAATAGESPEIRLPVRVANPFTVPARTVSHIILEADKDQLPVGSTVMFEPSGCGKRQLAFVARVVVNTDTPCLV